MMRTAIHRALGVDSGDLTSEMVDEAIEQAVVEGQELEWKGRFPEGGNLAQSDFPKDVAAMANAGGGLLVYGVREKDSAAAGREDLELTEGLGRQIRAVAASAVMPPLLMLEIEQLGEAPGRVVALQVKASEDAPHLIFRGDRFGAPVRNGADTRWMTERELEHAYRARFEARRQARSELEELYAHACQEVDTQEAAWFVGVARPVTAMMGASKLERPAAMSVVDAATDRADGMLREPDQLPRLLPHVRPVTGLRSWVFRGLPGGSDLVRASLGDDGSVAILARLGRLQTAIQGADQFTRGQDVSTSYLEVAVAALAGLVDAMAAQQGRAAEVDVMAGIAWDGLEPICILPSSGWARDFGDPRRGTEIRRYRPVSATWAAGQGDRLDRDAVVDFAVDLLNQGGMVDVEYLRSPSR